MFASRGLFWNITCPYQESCKLHGCIFAHPNGKENGITSEAVSRGEALSADDGKGQRKRRKLDNDEPALSTTGLPSRDRAVDAAKSPKGTSQLSSTSGGKAKERTLVNAPVSPPLQRKTESSTATTKAKSSQYGTVTTPEKTALSKVTPTPKSVPQTPVKKSETLNPRLLKATSPAAHDYRLKLVKALFDQFTRLNSELAKDANDEEDKFVLSEQELIIKALDIEENAAYTPSIYQNVVKNNILLYKRMSVQKWKEDREKELKQAKETAVILSDTPVSKPAQQPKVIETGLSPNEELKLLYELHTPVEGLSNHGYVTSIPTAEDIESARKGVEAANGYEICDRCKTRFQVFPGRREDDGALTSHGICTYHFGKPYWPDRTTANPKGKQDKRYRCCNQLMGESAGCTTAEHHVFKISEVKRMALVLNFEKTPGNMPKISDRPVCIDGEMGYTVYGLELIRLTATSWPNGEVLFDILVRPFGEILDLNTRYSGVKASDMADAVAREASPDATPRAETDTKRKLRIVDSPAAARALLFSHLSPWTPLIGHGLENDMNAVRIIHPTIIDTALLFPHKAGLPYRNGLKMLMQTHLNRQIQVVNDGKMDGHDSKEDANAAGELVRYALANKWAKMQKEGWTAEHGEIWAPLPRPITPEAPSGRKRSRVEMDAEVGEVDDQ